MSRTRLLPAASTLAAALLLAACAAPDDDAMPEASAAVPAMDAPAVFGSELHSYRAVTVADGLVNPWSIAFLPGGDILITERPGRLRVVRDGVLQPEPVAGVPEVRAQGQGGLLDVVPHPQFASNQLLYLSFSKPLDDGSQGTTAVVRGRFDGQSLTDVEEIFEARAVSTGNGHYGSRLAFDDAGYLFVSVGDRQAPPSGELEAHPAQDLTNHQGTILRLHDDGSIPEDNPFVGRDDALPEIWSYGHRSPQGLAVNPETGELWMNEHGPEGGDELNLVQPGRNYGWPVIGYGVNYRSGLAIHEGTRREGMESPVHFWVPSIATSGLLFYTGDAFPEWRGNVFVGGLAGERVARLTLDRGEDGAPRVVGEETIFRGQGRIRDIRQGPDGFIYVAVEARGGDPTAVVRLEPTAPLVGSR